MNHAGRNVLTATRKRKDKGGVEESSYNRSIKGSFGNLKNKQQAPSGSSTTTSSSTPGEPVPVSSNRLLAGYMAYEFLTRGTLLGQKFDPARAEALPLAAAESKMKRKPSHEAEPSTKPKEEPNRSYAELAQLLKTDGVHIPGIVNPSQLARWIQM